MMADLIDRQAAIDILMKEWKAYKDYPYVSHVRNGLEIAIVILENKVPSAQRTGRWIDDELMCKARCSVCGEEFSWMDNDMDRFWFCPNCGSYNGVEHE